MKINTVNNQNFGKVILKNDACRYIIGPIIPVVIKPQDNNPLYDKYIKVSKSDDTDIIIEKSSGRYNDYILFSVIKNGKNVKSDFHYCQNTKENTQELLETLHEILDFALYGKKRKV